MKRFLIVLALSIGLLGLAFWLQKYFKLETAVAITGIIGTAAAVAALVDFGKSKRRPRFTVSDAWFNPKGSAADAEFFGFVFGATIINGGDRSDVLLSIDHRFYHNRFGFIDSTLTCGAKEVTAESGHVLPIKCRPGVTYSIQGVADMPVQIPAMETIVRLTGWEGYFLRCKFRFAHSRSVTVRATRGGLAEASSFSLRLKEIGLLIRTLNKNPFTQTA